MFWESSPYSHPVVGWPSRRRVDHPRAGRARTSAPTTRPTTSPRSWSATSTPTRRSRSRRSTSGASRAAPAPPPEMITAEMPQLAEKRFDAEAETNPEVNIRFHAVPFDHKDMLRAPAARRPPQQAHRPALHGAGRGASRWRSGEPYAYLPADEVRGVLRGRRRGQGRPAARGASRPRCSPSSTSCKASRSATTSCRRSRTRSWPTRSAGCSRTSSSLLQLLLYDSSGDWQFLNDVAGEAPGGHRRRHPARWPRSTSPRRTATSRSTCARPAARPRTRSWRRLPAQMQGDGQAAGRADRAAHRPGEARSRCSAQLQQMAGQVPPAMKPALDYIMKKAQEHLDTARRASRRRSSPSRRQGGK